MLTDELAAFEIDARGDSEMRLVLDTDAEVLTLPDTVGEREPRAVTEDETVTRAGEALCVTDGRGDREIVGDTLDDPDNEKEPDGVASTLGPAVPDDAIERDEAGLREAAALRETLVEAVELRLPESVGVDVGDRDAACEADVRALGVMLGDELTLRDVRGDAVT